MKKMKVIGFAVAVLVLPAAGYAVQGGLAAKQTAKVQWVQTYSQDNWTDDTPKLICTDANGYYVVGRSSFCNGRMNYDFMLWVWRLDNEGRRLWNKPLLVDAHNDPNKIEWDSNFVCLKNERLVLINETGKKAKFRMIRFDEAGKITLNKKLSMGGYSHVLRDIVPVQGSYLIAVWELKDNKNPNAMVLKIDCDGNELWQKIYDKGKSEDATSIAVGEDGGFTLAANSGQYNKFGAGLSDVWIVKCGKTGNILAETSFPGRHPTIAMTRNGHYAVSYNVADFPAGDMYITGLDEKLDKIWEIKSIDKNPGSGIYRIAVDSRGNFVVAGSKFGKLWLWKISDKGAVVWDAPVNNQNDVVQVESLLVNGCDYVLAGGAIKQSPVPRDENNKRKEDVQWDINDILVSKVTEVNTD
jgi:hypothetical protein